jgi:hypothetical protein
MEHLLDTEDVLVIRTDFSDDAAWEAVCAALREPDEEFGYVANVVCVNDPRYAGLSEEQLTALAPKGPGRFMFLVDRVALSDLEHPLLVVDLNDEPERTFRTIPSEVGGIEVNLSLANMDYVSFADAIDPDGIFRGF